MRSKSLPTAALRNVFSWPIVVSVASLRLIYTNKVKCNIMEDSSYTSLKHSLCSVPAKALKYSTRLKLSNDLNIKIVLPAKNGIYRDYRGLAELMGFQYSDTKKFERHEDPTIKLLEAWETDPDAMLNKLIDYLIEMERHDVIKELSPLLERDAKSYLQRQKLQEVPIQVPEVTSCPVNMCSENIGSENELQLFTRDDIRNGECTYYDAYVSYADDDIGDVRLFADYLESPDIGLKLFIRARDMLAGCVELATNIELIKNRCRRMLIILTPNYLRSPACEFQTSFAASLAIDQSQRMLIPVIIEPCEIPLILKYVSKIDFTKPGNNNWVYEKLINSLLPEHRTPMFLSPEKGLKQICPPRLRSLGSIDNTPAVTFPSSEKQSSDTRDNTVAEVSSITSVSSESALKNTSSVSSKSKKWRLQFYNHLKRGRNSSSRYSTSDSASSSSSATSGFHSQSNNTLEDFESLIENSSDTAL